MTTQSARYAMDGGTPVRHVVTILKGASGPLSLQEMAETYQHPVYGDLTRIKKHEWLPDDEAAKIWLMRYAVTQLGPQQIEEVTPGMYQLRVPADEIRHEGKPVTLYEKETPQFHGGSRPFDPMSGVWSENIRAPGEADDLTELRESFRQFGWIPHFPAIRDERGVVLVGHRRLKVATELGIEPIFIELRLGSGSDADAMRVRLALASNIGFRQMTPTTRKRIAGYLYGDQQWSMEKIGKALRVSKSQISYDLDNSHFQSLEMSKNTRPVRLDSLGRKASPGRPKMRPNDYTRKREILQPVLTAYANHRDGLSLKELAPLIGKSDVQTGVHSRSLCAAGFVEPVKGQIGSAGRPLKTFRITEAGKEWLQGTDPAPVVEPTPHEHIWVCRICGEEHP